MRQTSYVFVPVLALALTACSDMQGPTSPRASSRGRAVMAGAPNAVGWPTTVIYSNFGPGMTFDHGNAWGVYGPGFGAQQAVSQQFFTTPGDYALVQAKLALARIPSPAASVLVILQADSSGRPGHIIEKMAFDPIASTPAIYVANSLLTPVLRDTLYWLTVTALDTGVAAAWSFNLIGDVSLSMAFNASSGLDRSWLVRSDLIRGAFEVDGRPVQPNGVVHQASGGGTVLWRPPPGATWDTVTVTYGITARQMADGSVKGELLFHQHGDQSQQFKGTVTCLTVVGNRAFLSGDLTQSKPPFSSPHFAIGLEDNGEGSNAIQPDRISSLILLPDGWPPCYRVTPLTNWTHGNAQVK